MELRSCANCILASLCIPLPFPDCWKFCFLVASKEYVHGARAHGKPQCVLLHHDFRDPATQQQRSLRMLRALPTYWVWKLEMHLGDCQNYGPFLGPYYNTGPNTGPNLGDPKKDHNFDNPPSMYVAEVRCSTVPRAALRRTPCSCPMSSPAMTPSISRIHPLLRPAKHVGDKGLGFRGLPHGSLGTSSLRSALLACLPQTIQLTIMLLSLYFGLRGRDISPMCAGLLKLTIWNLLEGLHVFSLCWVSSQTS